MRTASATALAKRLEGVDWVGEFDRNDADVVKVLAGKIGLQQPVVLETVAWALHFAVLTDIHQDLVDLPAPFEPLVRMFERGGTFALDAAGYIEVDTAAIPKVSLEQSLERSPLDLDETSLNALDGRPGLYGPRTMAYVAQRQ